MMKWTRQLTHGDTCRAPIPYQNGGTWYGMYSNSKNKDAHGHGLKL